MTGKANGTSVNRTARVAGALDALEILVPHGADADPELDGRQSRLGHSRWYPVEGGHRVHIMYEGGPYNSQRFPLAKGAWDR